MKNVKRILIIVCIILCFFVSCTFASTGKVNTEATRVRKEANTTSTILTIAYEGDKVEILDTKGEWYKIKFDGYIGYVKKEFIDSGNNVSDNKTVENTNKDNNSIKNNNVSENKMTNNTNKNTIKENTNNIENTTNTIPKDNTVNNVIEDNTIRENDEKYVTNTIVNVRRTPNILSKKISQIENNKQITKILETNNWVKITDGNITGWIPKNKISVATNEQPNQTKPNTQKLPEKNPTSNEHQEVNKQQEEPKQSNINKTGKINVETAKVREKASSSATIVAFLDYNDKVKIIAEDGDWYKVTSDDISGYVNKKLITISEPVSSRSLQEDRKQEENDTTVSQEINNTINQSLLNVNNIKGNQVVEFAKQFLGCSYVLGGKNPITGFDCSGFTKYVYSNFGYTLGNTAATQNSLGQEILRENMEPGDLILFYDDTKTKIGHTGIYLGEGSFIHAANPQRGVVTDNLNTNSYYNTRFITARRIVD